MPLKRIEMHTLQKRVKRNVVLIASFALPLKGNNSYATINVY